MNIETDWSQYTFHLKQELNYLMCTKRLVRFSLLFDFTCRFWICSAAKIWLYWNCCSLCCVYEQEKLDTPAYYTMAQLPLVYGVLERGKFLLTVLKNNRWSINLLYLRTFYFPLTYSQQCNVFTLHCNVFISS